MSYDEDKWRNICKNMTSSEIRVMMSGGENARLNFITNKLGYSPTEVEIDELIAIMIDACL